MSANRERGRDGIEQWTEHFVQHNIRLGERGPADTDARTRLRHGGRAGQGIGAARRESG